MTADLLSQVIAEGAVVTYLLVVDQDGQVVQLGEFPHCAPWYLAPGVEPAQCIAQITVGDVDGLLTDRCTREVGHRGPHVSHERPGLPTIAWLEKR